MRPKHTNPAHPREARDGTPYEAFAPYNFVPLPEKVVTRNDSPLHDRYDAETAYTGWIDYELETHSQVYVRGMMTEEDFIKYGKKMPEDLQDSEHQKIAEKLAGFYSTSEDQVEGFKRPAIPGSTLRGLIRTIVEIVGYGTMRWVGKTPTFTYRAVAAMKDDPLSLPYREFIGSMAKNVRAGYLTKKGDVWFIQPALSPQDMNWPIRDFDPNSYLKVREDNISGTAIPNFVRLRSPNYHPQFHKVTFGIQFRHMKGGQTTVVTQIGCENAGYQYNGVLVCTGNMLETARKGQRTKRCNHALILEPANNQEPLKIDKQVIEDYRNGITPYQKEELKHYWIYGDIGVLSDGAPVFYVSDKDEVIFFGHCPNFRIPARVWDKQKKKKRAATPHDFVPEDLLVEDKIDLADAIFGWVKESAELSHAKRQCAGRVFFSDAHFASSKDGVWYHSHPIFLHTLGEPKPSTFQHYLVQDKNLGHNPDRKETLAHFATPREETTIRGHKLYWHKGSSPDIEASIKEREHPKQLTRVVPIKAGVKFSGRIYFENLQKEELGALLWSLILPGEKDKSYCHKLGMGKPLGMGAVSFSPKLTLTDRKERYARLFEQNEWHLAKSETADIEEFIRGFEHYILSKIDAKKDRLIELNRIQSLFTMLQWREGDTQWLEKTRYMEIEHGVGANKSNEYKERPVLGDPLYVVGEQKGDSQSQMDENIVKIAQQGVVLDFGLGPHRSYGYIQPSASSEKIFVHRNNLSEGLTALERGQKVLFEIVKGMDGRPQATNVHLIR